MKLNSCHLYVQVEGAATAYKVAGTGMQCQV
jgi:hypothetical protein